MLSLAVVDRLPSSCSKSMAIEIRVSFGVNQHPLPIPSVSVKYLASKPGGILTIVSLSP